MKKRAAELLRVSDKKQLHAEDIPTQKETIRKYAQENDYEILKSYIEPGISAFKTSHSDRDILQKALKDARKGEFEYLLIFKSDRLSRRAFEYPVVLNAFHECGVKIIAVAENRELVIDDQYQKLIRFVEGWQAEMESVNTSIRVSEALERVAREGKWTGGSPPYGFKISDMKNDPYLQINEDEAQVVTIMFDYYEKGFGFTKIAQMLNKQGHKTRKGKDWTSERVRDTMQNPIVCGIQVYRIRKHDGGRHFRKANKLEGSNLIVPKDEDGNIKIIERYQIISYEKWLEAMAEMKRRRFCPSNNAENFGPGGAAMYGKALFTGFLRCGYCEGPLVSGYSQGKEYRKNGSVYVYSKELYRCLTKLRKGKDSCEGQFSYSMRKIDPIVLSEIKKFFSNLDADLLRSTLEESFISSQIELTQKQKYLKKEHARHKKLCEEWIKRLEIFMEDPSSSLYEESFIATKIREHAEKIKDAEKASIQLQAETAEYRKTLEKIDAIASSSRKWIEKFGNAETFDKKQMLKDIIEVIIVWKDKIEIKYNISLDLLERRKADSKSIRFNKICAL